MKAITILGANGTLGKGVAKLCASKTEAKLYLVCREIQDAARVVNAIIEDQELQHVDFNRLIPCNYSELKDCVQFSDWVFESIKEDLIEKQEINLKIEKYLKEGTFVSTGTSSYSVEELSRPCSTLFKSQYYGTHFFNPPNKLHLLEFLTTKDTDHKAAQVFETFFAEELQRTVIRLKDIRGFLANRVGISFLHEASKLALELAELGGIKYIDSIMGIFTGRGIPPFKTVDYIGIDVYLTILKNIGTEKVLKEIPEFLVMMNSFRWLGRKSGIGCYQCLLQDNGNAPRPMVYDIQTHSYIDDEPRVPQFAESMISHIAIGNIRNAFIVLRNDLSAEAQYCKYLLLQYILIAYKATKEASFEMEVIDDVMEQGYGWISPRKLVDLLGHLEGIREIIRSSTIFDPISDNDYSWVNNFAVSMNESDVKFFQPRRQ